MKIKGFVFLLFIFSLNACQKSEYVFNQHQALGSAWSYQDSLKFTFSPQDSIQKYNVFISLRNSLEYEFQNLFLISTISFPNGKVVIDTLEYPMANKDGSFMGTGTSLIENKLWLKENVTFNEQGEYTFQLRHAMRKANEIEPLQELKGIVDVGLQIEKSIQE